ncbi:MAG: hypothetical protein L0Y72_30015 [Gemmataceae bacterium]|nr:hypothetical protein [Gemmataceae bacterium]
MLTSQLALVALFMVAGPPGPVLLTPDTIGEHGYHLDFVIRDPRRSRDTKWVRPTAPVLVEMRLGRGLMGSPKELKAIKGLTLIVRDGDATTLEAPVHAGPATTDYYALSLEFSTHKDLLPKMELWFDEDGERGWRSFTLPLKPFLTGGRFPARAKSVKSQTAGQEPVRGKTSTTHGEEPRDVETRDRAALQGSWTLESIDGKRVEKGRTIKFDKDTVTGLFLDEEKTPRVTKFRLLAGQEVKGIDVGPQLAPNKDDGFKMRGIYELESDTLKLVFLPKLDARNPPSGLDRDRRPKGFDPKLVQIWVFRKAVKEPRNQQAAAIAEITKVGGEVKIDENAPDKPVIEVTLASGKVTDEMLAQLTKPLNALPHLRKLTVVSSRVTDAGLKHLGGLKALEELRLNCNIVGTGLKDLAGLPKLRALEFLCSAELTDQGFANVNGLAKLQRLRLIAAPKITDAAMKDLSGLASLQELALSYTAVTDAGLDHLKKLTELRRLYLRAGQQIRFSEEGIAELQRALPKCKIMR